MMRFPIAAITDEYSPTDLGASLTAMAEAGMTGAEVRVISGRNMIALERSVICLACSET